MQPQVSHSPSPQRAQLSRIWNALRRHPFMKLSALLLAVIFWAVVIASDPALLIEKTISSATVTITGTEALKAKGFIVTTDLSKPMTVKMRVEVKSADYDLATAESFNPRIDLSQQITASGRQQVKITATYSSWGTVISFEPESIWVDVEPYTRRSRVPIEVEQRGTCPANIWFQEPIPELEWVAVSGPKSLVDQVQRAVVGLPLNSLTASRPQDSLSALIELQDASANPVSTSQLSITNESVPIDSIRISVQVFPMRDVPVHVASAVTGVPQHGYELGEVRVSPASIRVAAAQNVLDTLETLFVSVPADVSEQNENVLATATIRPVTGVVYRSANEVTIEAVLQQAHHVHTYLNIPVTVMGLSPNLSAKIARSAMSVVISGDYVNVEPLKAESIHLWVDAEGLVEGIYTLPVLCQIDGTEAFEFKPEMPNLTLVLTKTNP